MKVQISVDEKLMERVDRYADENYMSRSGLITLALTEYLNQKDFMLMMKDMSLVLKKIAESGTVDHEVMEQLEDFERVCKLLVK